MGFSRQEYWSGLPFPSSGDLPYPEIKSKLIALAGRFFTTEPPGNPRELLGVIIASDDTYPSSLLVSVRSVFRIPIYITDMALWGKGRLKTPRLLINGDVFLTSSFTYYLNLVFNLGRSRNKNRRHQVNLFLGYSLLYIFGNLRLDQNWFSSSTR